MIPSSSNGRSLPAGVAAPGVVEQALKALSASESDVLDDLIRLARIPSVSARPVPDPGVTVSADCVAELMWKAGMREVERLTVAGAHPYVLGHRVEDPRLPTVLLYAHHDVQPEGDPKRWTSPPFEPTRRGSRIYGRGIVDDKAGVLVHLAAIGAWVRSAGRLPVNVHFLVEGEEEIGSEHLETFLHRYRDKMPADAIVLTDTANLAAGLPSLTTRLRGLVKVEVSLRGYAHALHSGMWGGPVPDPVMGLSRLLASLTHDDGGIAVRGLLAGARAPRKSERKALGALPFSEKAFRADAGAVKGLELHADGGGATYEAQWHRPALAITALEASPVDGSSNQIVPSARCRIGVRIVPGQDPRKVTKALVEHLHAHVPWGLALDVKPMTASPAWSTEPDGPAFDAARRALKAGYGTDPVEIGAGGSIPFVGPFAKALGGVPALLIGLEDPACNAHAEDESLLLPDFWASCRSAVHLYAELAGALRPRRAPAKRRRP
jgi:acetylornithine deacetylase/succinyl-diaminopimelate desuccinylase-like protein